MRICIFGAAAFALACGSASGGDFEESSGGSVSTTGGAAEQGGAAPSMGGANSVPGSGGALSNSSGGATIVQGGAKTAGDGGSSLGGALGTGGALTAGGTPSMGGSSIGGSSSGGSTAPSGGKLGSGGAAAGGSASGGKASSGGASGGAAPAVTLDPYPAPDCEGFLAVQSAGVGTCLRLDSAREFETRSPGAEWCNVVNPAKYKCTVATDSGQFGAGMPMIYFKGAKGDVVNVSRKELDSNNKCPLLCP